MALRLKRGTTAERLTYTPLNGELVYDTDQKAIYIGDGALAGGKLLASGGTIIDDIVLNGNDITGTGDIDITGNIDVTGNIHAQGNITADGTITLGNNDADEVEFKAEIISNIVPDINNTYDLGTPSKKWNTLNVNTVNATTVNGNTVGYHTGDQTGSVFADNSTLLVDATSGRIVGPVFANVTGNTTGTHTGNVIGNVLGDINGNLAGVVTGSFIGAVQTPSGEVLFDTRLSGDITIPANLVGDVFGSVYANDSTRLVDAIDGLINADGTVSEVIPLGTNQFRVGTRERRFTTGYFSQGLNIADRHLKIDASNNIAAWGGVYNNVRVETTLSADIPDGVGTTNFTVTSGSGIRNGAKFYLNGTSELEVQSIVGNTVTTTGAFTPSGNLLGQTVRFFNPSDTPSVTFRDAAPVTSKGLNGDRPGMVYANANYIYFCIAPWDGTTDIWVRTSVILATF